MDVSLALQVSEALIRRFEGFRSRPYLCSAGVPTIGYGSTTYLDGRRVQLTDPAITELTARVMLLESVKRTYLPAVLQLCPGLDNPQRLAAIIDFTYNLGSSRLKASTLRRRINQQDWESSRAELKKWVRGGGRVLRGLVIRRDVEASMM